MAPYTSGNCRIESYPPVLMATWEVTISQGCVWPEDSDDEDS